MMFSSMFSIVATCFLCIVPLPPINLSISEEYEDKQNITVTFEWNPANGTGAEYFVESYSVSLSSELEEYYYQESIHLEAINLTLDYNVNYTATVVSLNCAGESIPTLLHGVLFSKSIFTTSARASGYLHVFMHVKVLLATVHSRFIIYVNQIAQFDLKVISYFVVDCGDPNPPTNGQIGNISRTTERADVTFTCDFGFIPVTEVMAVCTSDGVWDPLPENHTCMDGTYCTKLVTN